MKQENSKRDLILNGKKRGKLYIASAAIALLIAVPAYFYVTGSSGERDTNNSTTATNSSVTSDEVRYLIQEFNDGRARFFIYDNRGTTIKYFILKSSDGKLRAAFDACDVCWRAHKGYRQDGDNMVCNNCGRSFPSAMINVVTGGCNPSPLTISISGDDAVIKIRNIIKGDGYFSGAQL